MMKPSELAQLMREVTISQVRRQIRLDQTSKVQTYLGHFSFTRLNRSQILEEFFKDAKKKKA
jgi:hypothetical protein